MVPDAYIGATDVDDLVLPGEKGDDDAGGAEDVTGGSAGRVGRTTAEREAPTPSTSAGFQVN